MKLDEEGEYW